jgi:Protein of unknown function (DUF3800)
VVPQVTAEEAARMNDHLIIQPNTLVLYIDEAGDERLNNQKHPIFAFGGVACVAESHLPIARAWQAMKALTFPQVVGPLHAKTHLRDRLAEPKRLALLGGMAHQQLGRFGTVITSSTVVSLDHVFKVACDTLANRFANVAAGMAQLGFWRPPDRVVAVFEHSTRLAQHIEQHLSDLAIIVGTHTIPVEGCFMPKKVANPFLEMADFVVSTIGKNVKHQLVQGRTGCTPNFQTIFRDVGPPLADYTEITAVVEGQSKPRPFAPEPRT